MRSANSSWNQGSAAVLMVGVAPLLPLAASLRRGRERRITVRIPERVAPSTTSRPIVSQATIRGRDFHRPTHDGKMGRVPFPPGEATGGPNRAAHEGGQGAA